MWDCAELAASMTVRQRRVAVGGEAWEVLTAEGRDAVARAVSQREAEQTIQDDPAVRELMAQFPTARIVPGSIKPQPADPREARTN